MATGLVNVIAGGGSMISLPALIFLGLPGAVANATNRVGIIAQNISAVIAFHRKGFSNLRLSLTLSLCTLPGAIFGALVAAKIRTQDFKVILAVIMGFVIVLMLTGKSKHDNDNFSKIRDHRTRYILAHFGMIFVGIWGGFIGMGNAFLKLPILNRILGLDLVTANMHKVTIALVYTSVALITFATQLDINWLYGFYLAGGTVIGAYLGTHLQIKRGHNFVRWILIIVVIIFILRLLFTVEA